MNRGYFVTGTDTGVGKTLVSSAILSMLGEQGVKAVGMKPVASGCVSTARGLRNEDAESLITFSGIQADYSLINPYAFEPAIAPHLAAEQAGIRILPDIIQEAFDTLSKRAEVLVVEGVGGWQVPLNDSETMESLAKILGLPVILVVGIRLGCINHALLTYQAIQQAGLECCAWVANQLEEQMPCREENIASIGQRLPIPCWGVIPRLQNVNTREAALNLNLPKI